MRFHLSEQRSASGLLEEFRSELIGLHAADPLQCETILLIHPWVLADFAEYNDFLGVCEAAIAELGLEGELQVASFHPHYQFADTQPEDIENYTNRSPHPMLHCCARPASSAPSPRCRIRRRYTAGISALCAIWVMRGGGAYGAASTLRMGTNSMASPCPMS